MGRTSPKEPPGSLVGFGDELAGESYIRLDTRQLPGAEALRALKPFLAPGFPCACEFTVFSSALAEIDDPAPMAFDSVCGGQAVVAVGFDDGYRIRSTRGALLVRSASGPSWGNRGHGWLPYA
jgi:C1A family cysteine protease